MYIIYTHIYICEYFYKYIHILCECVCMFGREKLERESWEGGKDLEKEGVVTDTMWYKGRKGTSQRL